MILKTLCRESGQALVSLLRLSTVIPAKAGIHNKWIPDRVGDDNTSSRAHFSRHYALTANRWVSGILSSGSVSIPTILWRISIDGCCPYILSIMALANPEHDISVAPVMSRARS